MTSVPPASPAPLDVRTLERAARALADREAQLVGWGSGSVFEYFHHLFPVQLDYLVDSETSRWGQSRHGVEIVSPARLARDLSPSTFVIIYSSYWPEIQEALSQMGPVASLPASAVFADAATRSALAHAEAIAERARPRRLTRADRAIVVQGPLVPDITGRVLRTTSALHPRDAIVLSTWTDSDPDLRAELSTLVDEVVLSERPEPAGIQNRNCQIVSTRAGIERAMDMGARTILKTRTDLAVLDRDIFDRARWWLDSVGREAARAAGLRDRIVVPSSFTRKYLLYHPSDLVMLGDARDLLTYWSAPLDPRVGQLLSPDWMDRPLAAVNMAGNPTESYLGLAFCRALDRPATGALADSWAFYRDLFAVVDNAWFDLLWFKNLSIPDAAVRQGVRETVSHAFWQRLQIEDATAGELAEINPEAVAFRTMTGAAA